MAVRQSGGSMLTSRVSSGVGRILGSSAARVTGTTIPGRGGVSYTPSGPVSTRPRVGTSYSGGGGGSSAPRTYAVSNVETAALEAVRESARTGKPIEIPKFANTPEGIVQQGNFVAQVAKIQAGLQSQPLSASTLVVRRAIKKSEEAKQVVSQTNQAVQTYQAQGSALQEEAKQLQAQASTLNTQDRASVEAFNQRVSSFNQRVQDYSSQGKAIQQQVSQAQTVVAQANVQGQKASTVARVTGGGVAPLMDLSPKFSSDVSKIVQAKDTREPSVQKGPLQQIGGRSASETILTTKSKTPFKSDFGDYRVEKIQTETAESLLKKGALGTVLKEEARATDIVDLPTGIKKIGLSIAAVPGEFGQLFGSTVAKALGQKTVFQENKQFLYKSGEKTQVSEIYDVRRGLKETDIAFKSDPLGTSVDIGSKALILFPGVAGLAATKVISKSKLLQKGVIGLDKIVSKGESGVARAIYTGKKLLVDQAPLKVALKSSKGVTFGTLRTDVFSKLIGRKTIKLSDITTKDIAKAFTEKGKSQYLKFPKSEQELFKRASVGPQAKFIKKTFKNLGIKEKDIIGFSAESGKATGFIEAVTKKGVVKFKFVGSEPYGKFFASRTATGPFANLGSYDDIQVTFTPTKVVKPSVTVGVGQKGVLPTKNIKQSIKALGYDVSKTSPQLQAYFDKSLSAGARPPKLKELRAIFGEKEVAKGYITSQIKLAGKFVSSPSRIFKITGEEEFIAPFLTKTKLLGSFKERAFGAAIVKVGGKRVKLNIKQLLPEVSDDVLRAGKVVTSTTKVGKSVSGVVSRGAPNIKYINITPVIGGSASLSRAFVSPKNLSLSKAVSSASIPKISTSVPSVSISSPSVSFARVSTSVPKVSVSTPRVSVSSASLSVSTQGVSVPTKLSSVSKPSVSVSGVSVSVPKVSVSTPRVSVSIPRVSVSGPSKPSVPISLSTASTPISIKSPVSTPARVSTLSIPTSVPSRTTRISRPSLLSRVSQPKGVSSRSPSFPRQSYKMPRVSVGSASYPQQKYSLTRKTSRFSTPKYKETRVNPVTAYKQQNKYFAKNAFVDAKKLLNRSNMFGFRKRNDFRVKNVFSGKDRYSQSLNKKDYKIKSSRVGSTQRDNKYVYSNVYKVNFKYKNYPAYKYSTKLIDKEMFDIRA